jgi:hypothetical protein
VNSPGGTRDLAIFINKYIYIPKKSEMQVRFDNMEDRNMAELRMDMKKIWI